MHRIMRVIGLLPSVHQPESSCGGGGAAAHTGGALHVHVRFIAHETKCNYMYRLPFACLWRVHGHSSRNTEYHCSLCKLLVYSLLLLRQGLSPKLYTRVSRSNCHGERAAEQVMCTLFGC